MKGTEPTKAATKEIDNTIGFETDILNHPVAPLLLGGRNVTQCPFQFCKHG
jgi:hypothetical protein